jgi:hypothetical protein
VHTKASALVRACVRACVCKCELVCVYVFVYVCVYYMCILSVCVCVIIYADVSLETSVCKDMNLHVKSTVDNVDPNRLENIRLA